MERFSEAWQRYAPVLRAWTDLVMSDTELGAQAHAAAGGVARTLAPRIDGAGPHPGIDPNAAAEAVVAMVDRFHQLRQFAGEPVDASALDTLTTMVHRGLFGGGPPPEHVLSTGRTTTSPRTPRSPEPLGRGLRRRRHARRGSVRAGGSQADGRRRFPPSTAECPRSQPRRAQGSASTTRSSPNAGSVSTMLPAISSHVAPTSAASMAWRWTPGGLRRMTVHTMRMSSWVLRSGARSESICASQAFWASCRPGAKACSSASKGNTQSSPAPASSSSW